jgi:hypothetical protein
VKIISQPKVAAIPQSNWSRLTLLRALVGTVLFAFSVCIAAAIVSNNRCDTRLAKILVATKLDSYFSNCQCMKPALDFSDACNSMYLPLL